MRRRGKGLDRGEPRARRRATIVPGSHIGRTDTIGSDGPHAQLPQFGIINRRGLALSPKRPEYERGNAYNAPNYLKRLRAFGTVEAFDCAPNPGGEDPNPHDPLAATGENGANPVGLTGTVEPPCLVASPHLFDGSRFPRVPGPRDTKGVFPSSRLPNPGGPVDNDGTSCDGPGDGAIGQGSKAVIPLCNPRRSR